MDSILDELKARVRAHTDRTRSETPVPRLYVGRSDAATEPVPLIIEPAVCLVLQGAKSTSLGGDPIHYGAGRYFISSIAVPALGTVSQASAGQPFLAIGYDFDPGIVTQLLLDAGEVGEPEFVCPVGHSLAEPELLGAFLRVMRLLDRPNEITFLAPMIEREILFRLLRGPQGPRLRQIARGDSRLAQVHRAMHWIRENYREAFRIEDLSRMAGMSPVVFHRHFKALTTMTPVQYQKRFRLHAARRLLIEAWGDTSRVAFEVGYESASQFSREYSRVFGHPPARDAQRLRAALITEPAAG